MLPHTPRHPAAFAKPSQAAGRLLAFLLVAFMWLQFAGVLHKLIHADHAVVTASNSQSLENFFPSHSQQNKSDCQLLDLQCGGLALSQALPVLTTPVFAVQIASAEVAALLHQPSLVYQARAPPKTSI